MKNILWIIMLLFICSINSSCTDNIEDVVPQVDIEEVNSPDGDDEDDDLGDD